MKKEFTIRQCLNKVSIALVLFAECNIAFAQQTPLIHHPAYVAKSPAIKPTVYQNVIKSNQQIQLLTPDGNLDTVSVDKVKLQKNSKVILKYSDKVSKPSLATTNILNSRFNEVFADAKFKMIPELHVESEESGIQKAYNILFSSLQPMKYNFDRKEFLATISFLLVEEPMGSEGTAFNLLKPVTLEITSNTIHTITPGKNLAISHVSMPSSEVNIACSDVLDSVNFKIITALNPSGYETYLTVDPALELTPGQRSIQGYGVQEVPITIRFIGTNAGDSVRVSFSVDKGTVTPNPLTMKYNQAAIIKLRSEGQGAVKITAKSAHTTSNEVALSYSFPWLFLGSSVLGGLIGGSIKFYFMGTRRKYGKPILGSILIGIVGAISYYALGINLLEFHASAAFNEFAVLGFSALCAFFGIKKGESV